MAQCQFSLLWMLRISWSVHSDMEVAENAVQNTERTVKKKRDRSEKVGASSICWKF